MSELSSKYDKMHDLQSRIDQCMKDYNDIEKSLHYLMKQKEELFKQILKLEGME